MRKSEELSNPNSCLNKANDDEPVFVLRAQDAYAPMLVEMWAEMVGIGKGFLLADMDLVDPKLKEAFDCAQSMRDWQNTHERKIPD